MDWLAWVRHQWPKLEAGVRITAPDWLPTPNAAGFRPLALATPEGQCADWGLSMNDGSRVHVHQFPDGRRQVHRDQYDPDQGFGRMLAHLCLETWVGPAAAVCGLLMLASSSKA
jgi:hypothetical protein